MSEKATKTKKKSLHLTRTIKKIKMSKTEESKFKTKSELNQIDKKLSASIMLAIEMDSTFKLYSYRIIDQNAFMHRVSELIAIHKKETN